jgi:hypothetical protein
MSGLIQKAISRLPKAVTSGSLCCILYWVNYFFGQCFGQIIKTFGL